jgi:hypothetical protein
MEMIMRMKEYLNITRNIITQTNAVPTTAPTPVYILE